MVKNKNNRKLILQIAAVTLMPASLFWILYRFGFWKILDALAISVMVAFGVLLVLRFLFNQRVISFKK